MPQTAVQPALLLLRVLEGEGELQTTNAKMAKPITVLVSSETGRPLANVAVSFRLPESGASGRFATGVRTEVGITGADGKATIRGIQWGNEPGQVTIRVTALRGEARAGTLISMQLTAPASEAVASSDAANQEVPVPLIRRPPPKKQQIKKQGHWVLVTSLIGSAAAGGVVALSQRSRGVPAGGGPPAVSAGVTQPASSPVAVGLPTISIGKP